MTRKHILFAGKVQGVGFRYHSSVLARECHLSGWVRNLSSGDVEMEIQGKQIDIDRFLFTIGENEPYIRIVRMDVSDREEIDETGFFERF